MPPLVAFGFADHLGAIPDLSCPLGAIPDLSCPKGKRNPALFLSRLARFVATRRSYKPATYDIPSYHLTTCLYFILSPYYL